jgi:hypothetical protein
VLQQKTRAEKTVGTKILNMAVYAFFIRMETFDPGAAGANLAASLWVM